MGNLNDQFDMSGIQKFKDSFIDPLLTINKELSNLSNKSGALGNSRGLYIMVPRCIHRFYFFKTNNSLAVLIELLAWMNEEGRCNVYRSILADYTRINESTLDRAISDLIEKKFIKMKPNKNNNSGNDANTYKLIDLTTNPYLLLSEALHTVRWELSDARKTINKKLREDIQNNNERIKKIELIAEGSPHHAFLYACSEIAEILEVPLPKRIPQLQSDGLNQQASSETTLNTAKSNSHRSKVRF